MKVKSLSRVFTTPWTVAYQAPLSMGFSRKSTGVGCHCLLQARELKVPKVLKIVKISFLMFQFFAILRNTPFLQKGAGFGFVSESSFAWA